MMAAQFRNGPQLLCGQLRKFHSGSTSWSIFTAGQNCNEQLCSPSTCSIIEDDNLDFQNSSVKSDKSFTDVQMLALLVIPKDLLRWHLYFSIETVWLFTKELRTCLFFLALFRFRVSSERDVWLCIRIMVIIWNVILQNLMEFRA